MTQIKIDSETTGAQSEAGTHFQFTRLIDGQPVRGEQLSTAMGSQDLAGQTWVFVSPHDDDLCIGAGLFIQAAARAGIDVQILIVTDGCLGYCREDHRENIVDIRQAETYESFQILGISDKQVTFLGYPDGGLMPYIGRRSATGEKNAIQGWVGLQNSFTHYLRHCRPTRVFVPTHTDLHPDHRITHSELMISLFHASGAIWPELGPPLLETPSVGELAVYCDFAEPPNLEVIGDDHVFDIKLKSIEAYRSQVQIASLVANIRQAGPYEYIRESEFRLFSPNNYKAMFKPST